LTEHCGPRSAGRKRKDIDMALMLKLRKTGMTIERVIIPRDEAG
jgi:hypothetical protein